MTSCKNTHCKHDNFLVALNLSETSKFVLEL